jgi:hypothetical protein
MSRKISKPTQQELEKIIAELPDELSDDIVNQIISSVEEGMPEEIGSSQGSYQVLSSQPYRLSDPDDFPIGTYIHTKTGQMMSKHFRISEEFQLKQDGVMDMISEFGFTEIYSRDWYGVKSYSSHKFYEKWVDGNLIVIQIGGIIHKWHKKISASYKKGIGVDVQLYSNQSSIDFDKVISRLTSLVKIRKEESNNIGLVIQTPRGYSTTSFELPKGKLDIELNYGKGFKPIHDKIINRLNEKNGKGLVLLHGTPGTGKTHYLKHLASKIKDKRVLFIPPYLADFITSPEMTPFLIENSNSILFIEDAERVITDRQSGGANGVSNILNITDGILSDILKIQIVATFNMDKAKIDSALLRKGRLIAEHKFDALGVDDANNLLKHLGKDANATKPMTLTEIYNVEEEEFKSAEKYSPIGFNNRY